VLDRPEVVPLFFSSLIDSLLAPRAVSEAADHLLS